LPNPQLEPGSRGVARIRFDAPAALVRGDRFILRGASPVVTIGGGVVLDPQPPRRGVRTESARERFARLSETGTSSAALCLIGESGLQGLYRRELAGRLGLTHAQQQTLLADWARTHQVVAVGEVLVSRERLDAVGQQVLTVVGEHHLQHPLEEGIPREELRERLCARAADGVFEHVITALSQAGHIVARDRVARRGHTLALTDEEAAVRDRVVAVLAEAGLAPPDGPELIARVGARKEVADRVMHLLVRQKRLVRLGDLLFHPDALQRLKDDVQSLKQAASERIDVATFKDRYQVTRKYAIPLLEFLDRERVTRRVGDVRVIL
jgi:selenocysteine-specific elongation factor